jgi:hypothetical protein
MATKTKNKIDLNFTRSYINTMKLLVKLLFLFSFI